MAFAINSGNLKMFAFPQCPHSCPILGTGGITDDDSSPTEPPPEKPPLPGCLVAPRGSRATTLLEPADGNMSPVQGYMFWFGQAAGPVSPREVDSDVVQDSKQLFDYFRSIWHHSEQEASPHERSKSISYTQHYGQQTTSGAVVHRTTTVSQTRKIKLVSEFSWPGVIDSAFAQDLCVCCCFFLLWVSTRIARSGVVKWNACCVLGERFLLAARVRAFLCLFASC